VIVLGERPGEGKQVGHIGDSGGGTDLFFNPENGYKKICGQESAKFANTKLQDSMYICPEMWNKFAQMIS